METSMRFSRRTFIAWAGGAGAGFYLFGRLPGMSAPIALAQIPGGSLDPKLIPKYTTPLLVPPVMPRADTLTNPGGKPVDYYEISMRQFDAADPAGRACRRRRSGATARSRRRASSGLTIHNAPSLTIEAKWKRPVRVKWINELEDAGRTTSCPTCCRSTRRCTGRTRPAARWDATCGRRSRSTPGPYTGPVPIVTHVHGAVGVATTATATPRRGTCPTRATSRASQRWAPGTSSSAEGRRRLRRRLGGPASPSSSTRTTIAPRRSGTTTTRSA